MARRPEVIYRTIDAWPDAETPASERKSSYTFKASLSDTQAMLRDEAQRIGASDLIVEVVGDSELFYRDGTGIRSDRAHRVKHVGCVVHLVGSRFGDLRYACDTFGKWEANLRAVALGLEALRKVERYGIARRGEQYAGGRPTGSRASASTPTTSTPAATRRSCASTPPGSWSRSTTQAEPQRAKVGAAGDTTGRAHPRRPAMRCESCGATPEKHPEYTFWLWPEGDEWAGEGAGSCCWVPPEAVAS